MPWIESHSVLVRHRKLKEFARALNVKPVQALGHLHALWHTAIEQAEDGDLSKWSAAAIADAAQWEGSEQEFLNASLASGFMDEGPLLHDWIDYAGKYLTSKYKTSNRDRLKEIWAKFGKEYGKEFLNASSPLPLVRPQNITEHNRTDKTGQTNTPLPPKGGDSVSSDTWFQNPEFKAQWEAWRKGRKKAPGERQLAHLRELSGGDLALATRIVKQSADEQWTGLFAIKGANGVRIDHRAEKRGKEHHESLTL
jgi:hypothetical protein